MKTVNDQVAVAPLSFNHEQSSKPSGVKGFDTTDRLMNSLVASTAVFDSSRYQAGQKLFFRADIANQPFVRSKFKHGGTEFILIPESFVIAVDEPQ